MSKERYNEIIDITYQEYNELFNSYYPPFSAPYPKRLTKEEFIEELKRGDELTKEYLLDISIEEKVFTEEEIQEHLQQSGMDALRYEPRMEYISKLPKGVITLTYKNEKIKIYE